jgi:2-polyprenyl-3-methyl-5-hydroxy-6-metoxy-1,4-benzoquinol methylase
MDLDARIPEPELMIDPDQAAAYSAADFADAHQMLIDRFVDCFGPLAGRDSLDVLDLGCGPADVTVRLARALPNARITGVDGSEPMLAHGRARLANAGLADRVHLEPRLLPDPDLETRTFDVVVSTSVLHHLADPAALWTTIARCTAPGGAVFVADLRRPPDKATLDDLVARAAGDEPEVLVADFRNSLCASYRPDEVRAQVAAAGLDLTVEELGERHLTAWGHAPT